MTHKCVAPRKKVFEKNRKKTDLICVKKKFTFFENFVQRRNKESLLSYRIKSAVEMWSLCV